MDNSSLFNEQNCKRDKTKKMSILMVSNDTPKLSQSSAYQYFVGLFKGNADEHFAYRNKQGKILAYILRWNAVRQKNGYVKKEIRPFLYCEFPNGNRKWCSKAFPALRPLFNLDKLTHYNESPVLICEGEKTALAAERLFLTWVITTTMQGAQSAKHTDYSPLKGRHVIIAMDHDDAGFKYGKAVYDQCQLAGAQCIQFLNLDVFSQFTIQEGALVQREQAVHLAKGYDLADALTEGWTSDLLLEFKKNTKMPLLIDYAALFPKTNSDDSDTQSLQCLATLSSLQYDRQRKDAAKRLGITLPTLDKEVEKLRSQNIDADANNQDDSDIFPLIEPWPEVVRAEELLEEISDTFKRFAILPDHADTALALWVIFTWFIDDVGVSPILAISSPEKRCGKTTVMSILGNLVRKPLLASNISAAALFRTVELWKPTIIIDEADTFIRDSDELRGIINSGHTRSTAYVIRTVGDDHKPKRFSTWGAKAIALIGSLPDTLNDRSIVIRLRRKLVSEKTEKLRHANPRVFDDLQRKLLKFSQAHATIINNSCPCFPENIGLSDRALDNWEPLLTLAELAGNTWVEKVYQAAANLSENDKETLPLGTELLKDIEKVFADKSLNRIHTVDLINSLCEDEESPWSMYNFRGQDKRITPRQLSKLLSPYQITTKNIEIGGVQRKGFDRYVFEESWKRYHILSTPSENAVFAVQPSTFRENCPFEAVSHPSSYAPVLPSTLHNENFIRPENMRKIEALDGWTPNTANTEGSREEEFKKSA